MTTNYTKFVNAYAVAWPDNVTDPFVSKWFKEFDQALRYNVQRETTYDIALDSGAHATLSLANLALTDWMFLVVRCIGEGYVSTSGKDASGTNITGVTPVFGNSILPGVLFFSTYNLSAAPTVTSTANGTVFQIFFANCVEDGG